MAQAEPRPLFIEIFRARKWGRSNGESVAVTIPCDGCKLLDLEEGDELTISTLRDRVIMAPDQEPTERAICATTRPVIERKGSLVINIPKSARKITGIRRGEHVVASIHQGRIEYRRALDAMEDPG